MSFAQLREYLGQTVETVKRFCTEINFIKIHYASFLALAFVASILIYPNQNLPYIDALYLGMSMCTQGGLNPVDLNALNSWQQIVVYILPMLTTPIFVNTVVVFVRLHYFRVEFRKHDNVDIAKLSSMQSKYRRTLSRSFMEESKSNQNEEEEEKKEKGKEKEKEKEKEKNEDRTQDFEKTGGIVISEKFIPLTRQRESSLGSIHFSLPPPRRCRDPGDIARSIRLMQHTDQMRAVDDGPALVIGPPQGDLPDTPVAVRASTFNTRSDDPFDVKHRKLERSKTIGALLTRRSSRTHDTPLHPAMSTGYLSYKPHIQSNSVFVDLTAEQQVELSGVEYRALLLLSRILVAYYVGWHILAVVFFTPWGVRKDPAQMFRELGFAPAWWGIFTAASSFNNLGLTLTPTSMSSFASSVYMLLVCPFFMIIGNTGFPIFLRFIIWILFKLTDSYGRMHESLGFLLDHPRRCFTHLFPAGPTWWLFGVIMALNIIDTFIFLALDFHAKVVAVIPAGLRVLTGLFQAVATRTTGFSIIDIGALHPAVIVSYTVMMYINIFPVAMSVRHTNVYEEQTLGIYAIPKKLSGVTTHIMRQVSYDLWFIFIALFILCISEEQKLSSGKISIFNVLFEVTSAYGTVGLSTGYAGTNTSLSGQFSKLGKFIIIVLLYRGRHRALPYSTDRAIIVPSEKLRENDRAQENMMHFKEALQSEQALH
ncbi:uncharacterized protein SAPINGB_P004185 [Magnusiomyces paraingens]|uniref:Potassium transport protein n=1 Tax=Magnusiomyces paraingens TaxID=2606893 RepID=A0A5E8BT28_9ASCO|nr:uncharacterized protein SAPINGB_P004185 [Saprochaete ingens]VVT54656.1 unnamed protein product [Saprochaete ingens]